MKIKPKTFVLALVLVIAIVVIVVPLVLGPRSEQVQCQNDNATAYVNAVKQQVSGNPAFGDFKMDLIRQGLRGGVINFRCTLASTNDEAEFDRILHICESPYEIVGSVSFKGTKNGKWIKISPNK